MHNDLFIDYLDSGVQEALNVFESEMECKILKINNTIYLLPDNDNGLLGFRNKEYREWLGSNAKMNDIYLSYYITILIFHKFYGGKNRNPKKINFLSVMDLLDDLDERFDAILTAGSDKISAQEERLGINMTSVAEGWKQRIVHQDNRRTTKHAFVIRICGMLEQEKLLRLVEDKTEIRTTKKLDDLMVHFYLNDSRLDEVNSIFEEVSKDAAN